MSHPSLIWNYSILQINSCLQAIYFWDFQEYKNNVLKVANILTAVQLPIIVYFYSIQTVVDNCLIGNLTSSPCFINRDPALYKSTANWTITKCKLQWSQLERAECEKKKKKKRIGIIGWFQFLLIFMIFKTSIFSKL